MGNKLDHASVFFSSILFASRNHLEGKMGVRKICDHIIFFVFPTREEIYTSWK